MDSDDNQIEDTGECRGDDMAQQEWDAYAEKGHYERTRDRYAGNTAERQAEKRAIFDEYDDSGETGKQFFECPEDWDTTFGDMQGEDKATIWGIICKFHGIKPKEKE